MPLTPKGRAEMLKRFNALRKVTRKPGFDGPPIILGATGGITRKKIRQVEERLIKKRNLHLETKILHIKSSDNIMLIKGAKVNATNLATRFSLNYLMKPLKINEAQKKVLKSIILHRAQNIKGTNIPLRPNLELMLIEFTNLFGENGHRKAELIAQKLTNRAKNLIKIVKKSKTECDLFYNAATPAGLMELYLSDYTPKEFAQHTLNLICKRELELKELKETNIPQKERYVKLLAEQILNAKRARLRYIQNNNP